MGREGVGETASCGLHPVVFGSELPQDLVSGALSRRRGLAGSETGAGWARSWGDGLWDKMDRSRGSAVSLHL